MRHVILGLSAVFLPATTFGEELLREVSWAKLDQQGKLSAGEVVRSDEPSGSSALKVENSPGEAKSVTILILNNPGITASRYALSGKVRYEDVQGKAYLEMWNVFDDGQYFTRAIAESGPMKHLEGSSDWRAFVLPFYINQEGSNPPKRLILNVVFPGKGAVFVGPLRLVQYADGEDPFAVTGQWWGNQTAGWIGGIFGSLFGCLSGLVGWLAAKAKARGFVLCSLMGMIVFGTAALIAGLVALIQSQPYAVYYPLFLLGALCTLIPAFNWRGVRRRYEDAELRKMSALDAS